MISTSSLTHARDIVVNSGYLAAKRHIIYGLAEVDVTLPRQLLQASHGGAPLSFTAFIVASLGRAIMQFPQVQAYRDFRGRLVLFHQVDVATLIEPEPGAVAFPHVIRDAGKRTVAEITDEFTLSNQPRTSARSGCPWRRSPGSPRALHACFTCAC